MNRNLRSRRGERSLGRGLPDPELQSPEARNEASDVPVRRAITRAQMSQPQLRIPPQEGATPRNRGATQRGREVMQEQQEPRTQRQRMKWNSDMNRFVMHCYYTATKNETEMVMYRQKMYELFKVVYPELPVTEQRVADQRRTIIVRELLPQAEIQEIKDVVRLELEQQDIQSREDYEENSNEHPMEETQATEQQTFSNEERQDQNENGSLSTTIRTEIQKATTMYDGIDPMHWPYIPKLHASKRLGEATGAANIILIDELKNCSDITQFLLIMYATARAIAKTCGVKLAETTIIRKSDRGLAAINPKWLQRISRKIKNLRSDISKLEEYKKGTRSRKLNKSVEKIIRKTRKHATHEEQNNTVIEVTDTLKQKLRLYAKRIHRYRKSYQRKIDNKKFLQNQRQFYRKLEEKYNSQKEPTNIGKPEMREMRRYWADIWSRDEKHKKEAAWIKQEKDKYYNMQKMEPTLVTSEEVRKVIKDLKNWRAPGVDKIHNYFYKKLTNAHEKITWFINLLIEKPEETPGFLTAGITYMLPKGPDAATPAKYRPITCLPNFYKILTACISNKIYEFAESNKILSQEQTGCKRRALGCKEQLVIDSVVMRQAYVDKRNIYTAFIDYQKAFDSVPHSWLIECLRIYKIDPQIVNFLTHIMKMWKTYISYQGEINGEPLLIKRGIFQGDALSPLWFCLSINPLSTMLNTGKGYAIKNERSTIYEITHLLFMDDIKLYAGTEKHLQHLIRLTETFSRDTKMTFGMEKCKTQSIKQGKQELKGYELQDGNIMEAMEEGEHYKYLGFEQARFTRHKEIKKTLKEKLHKRLEQICKTSLNSKNIFTAINTRAISVLTYSFGVVKWTDTDLEELERLIRTTLSKYRYHHPKSATERMFLPRTEGGRGLISIVNLHHGQVNSMRDYFFTKSEESNLHRATVKADVGHTPLNLNARQAHRKITPKTTLVETWKRKPLHGRFPSELEDQNVDKEASYDWLNSGSLYPETEGFMLAIQDQVVMTRHYARHIIGDASVETDLCRRCGATRETIHHIITGCQAIAQSDYKHRHDQVAKIVHQSMALKLSLTQEEKPYYSYDPENIIENSNGVLYWDRTILTDRTINANRPDITFINKKDKTAYLIDIAVPHTKNLQSTKNEKINKYRELSEEVKAQWKLEKVDIIPIVLSANGVIPKTLNESLQRLQIIETRKIIQKSVILSTCNIARKFLNI